MSNDLVRRFVEQELNACVRSTLDAALQERAESKNVLMREFEFNCFDVTLDFENEVVTLQDVLSSGADSSVELPISDFVSICKLLAQLFYNINGVHKKLRIGS